MITTLDYTSMGFDKIWLWADPHFGHEAIRKMCGRPWASADKMDTALLKNANSVVGDNDLLITVGDLTMFGPTKERFVSKIISQLPGKNVLVYGNHDRFKPKWYLNRGFIMAATSLVLPGGILVTHDPAEAAVWPQDKPVLCGHVHGLFRVLENVVNVGVDVWAYHPVQIETALGRCSEKRSSKDWQSLSNKRHNKTTEKKDQL